MFMMTLKIGSAYCGIPVVLYNILVHPVHRGAHKVVTSKSGFNRS